MMSGMTPPGWYDDPTDPISLRYWDGLQWSQHTHQRMSPAPLQPSLVPALREKPEASRRPIVHLIVTAATLVVVFLVGLIPVGMTLTAVAVWVLFTVVGVSLTIWNWPALRSPRSQWPVILALILSLTWSVLAMLAFAITLILYASRPV